MDRILRRVLLLTLPLLALPGCDRATEDPARSVEVRVGGVAVDERSESPVVILEELEGSRKLPIWIGFPEATSIASQLEAVSAPRPNTHDLTKRLIDGLEGTIARVVVSDLAGGVYYARIVLARNGQSVEVDARPSDAIALALRFHAPLFVSEPLFQRALEESGSGGDEQRI